MQGVTGLLPFPGFNMNSLTYQILKRFFQLGDPATSATWAALTPEEKAFNSFMDMTLLELINGNEVLRQLRNSGIMTMLEPQGLYWFGDNYLTQYKRARECLYREPVPVVN